MNPRRIEECLASISGLEIDKAWLRGYSETDLEAVVPNIMAELDYDRYVMVSDDVVVTPNALKAVLGLHPKHPVVTGWTNLDMTPEGLRTSSVVSQPFTENSSVKEQYRWRLISEVLASKTKAIRTWFAGLCLTCMSKEMWLRYPFRTWAGTGRSSDFDLSWRLQQDRVPVVAARDGGVFHVKELTNYLDTDPRKALHIGSGEVVLEPC